MKIAIDLNDVIRAYTSQFANYYKRNIDREFDIENIDIWTNDLKQIFPFETKQKYLEFLYNDYTYEIFACAKTIDRNTGSMFSDWCRNLEDMDEIPELCIVSTGEYDKSIGSTFFFLSKIGVRVGEVNLFLKSDTVWDTCDVLITANPELLEIKPENKKSIKIKTQYNQESTSDYEFNTFVEFMKDEQIIKNLNTNN